AALDISNRTKFAFWLGLGTTSNQWPVWHRGTVSFSVTLYDSAGNSGAFGFKRKRYARALEGAPHWQYISAAIPQMPSGLDYTTTSRCVITAWNLWDPRINISTGKAGQQVLQATAYINLVQAVASTTGSPGPRGGWYTLPGVIGTARAPLAIQ